MGDAERSIATPGDLADVRVRRAAFTAARSLCRGHRSKLTRDLLDVRIRAQRHCASESCRASAQSASNDRAACATKAASSTTTLNFHDMASRSWLPIITERSSDTAVFDWRMRPE